MTKIKKNKRTLVGSGAGARCCSAGGVREKQSKGFREGGRVEAAGNVSGRRIT